MIKNLYPYWYETYHSLEQQGLSQRKIAKEMQVHRTTLQHWLKEKNKGVIAKEALQEVHKQYQKSESKEHENQRILLISDLHVPYHHKDTLAFLQYLKVKYKPTRVICLGDLEDKHALSYHDSDPDLPSAGDELSKALPVIAKLHDMFPVMSILDSNHGSLVYRKAKTHGIPKSYIKPYNQLLGVGDGWTWHNDLVINLPDGNSCYLHHGKSARGLILTQQMGMSSVQGHYHNSFSVEYHGTPIALNWAMQVGCLIDHKSYAFSYANVNIKRQIIGTGLIIDSQPLLVPLLMDGNGNWIKPNDYDIVMCGET